MTVDARRNSDAVSAPFTLTVSILGATVSPRPDTIATATVGVPVARSYTITNIYGAFTGRAVGTTTYNYIDLISGPSYGTIAVTDANALRAAGASWVVPATVTANAVPAAGRVLYGNVQVRTDTNVLVGQGDVIVQSVTP